MDPGWKIVHAIWWPGRNSLINVKLFYILEVGQKDGTRKMKKNKERKKKENRVK